MSGMVDFFNSTLRFSGYPAGVEVHRIEPDESTAGKIEGRA